MGVEKGKTMDSQAIAAIKKVFDEIDQRDEARQQAYDRAFCHVCGRQVRLLTLYEVEALYITDTAGVIKLAEKDEIHWLHNSKGELRICSGFARRGRWFKKTDSVVLTPCEGESKPI